MSNKPDPWSGTEVEIRVPASAVSEFEQAGVVGNPCGFPLEPRGEPNAREGLVHVMCPPVL